MASINAQNVAKEVSENIRKGKKVKLGEIIKKNGYSESTSESPQRVTETDSYKEAINPIVNEWVKERNRLTKELQGRDLSKERYETMMKSLDVITKNIQLLSGGNTESVKIDDGLSDEQKQKLLELLK